MSQRKRNLGNLLKSRGKAAVALTNQRTGQKKLTNEEERCTT
jgi:hypothetical protein